MKALVFNQYMNALGGGERYMLGLAEALRAHYDVEIAAPFVPEPRELSRLGFDPPEPIRRLRVGDFTKVSSGYDLTAQISNYLPLHSRAAFSIVMVQFPHGPFNWKHPLHHRHGRRKDNEAFITNSEFSRSWCGPRWGVDATVIPPPVELSTDRRVGAPKLERLLAVGRFFRGGHAKRFDVLVEAFRALPADVRKGWELVLVGGTRERSSAQVLRELSTMSSGLNVRIVPDASREELRELYRGSSLYWQATGYGRRPDRPEHAEHFGIALVEAMSYGCVPFAYCDGGAPEILGPLGTDCLWTTVEELIRMTTAVICDDNLRAERAARAVKLTEPYSGQAFAARVSELVRSTILV